MTTVSVTAGHIANGQRQDCSYCPVALAIAEAFPFAAGYTEVGPAEVSIADACGRAIEIDLPAAAVEFIRAFDEGEPVAPFSFDLDYPEASA